jgi:hypothetical protein
MNYLIHQNHDEWKLIKWNTVFFLNHQSGYSVSRQRFEIRTRAPYESRFKICNIVIIKRNRTSHGPSFPVKVSNSSLGDTGQNPQRVTAFGNFFLGCNWKYVKRTVPLLLTSFPLYWPSNVDCRCCAVWIYTITLSHMWRVCIQMTTSLKITNVFNFTGLEQPVN